jgi:hypothetical protein
MRIGLLLIASCVGISGAVAKSMPPSPDAHAALASFQAFLDGLGRRDSGAMRAHALPGGHATLMRNGKPVQLTLEELIQPVSAPGSDSHEERINDPLVRVDNDVAVVWARFVFLINGKSDHCGRDVATLLKIDGEWLIASVEDTVQPACGPAR